MKKEFDLSEKIMEGRPDLVFVEDVKEFINKRNWLDMKLQTKQITWEEYLERRDKLAGEKLRNSQVKSEGGKKS